MGIVKEHLGWVGVDVVTLQGAIASVCAVEDLLHVLVHCESQLTDVNTVNRYSFALIAEVAELASDLHHKAWKPEVPMTEARRAAIIKEWTDVLAFFGTLTNIVLTKVGATPGELAQQFAETSELNVRRMQGLVQGYGTLYGRLNYLQQGEFYNVWEVDPLGGVPMDYARCRFKVFNESDMTFIFEAEYGQLKFKGGAGTWWVTPWKE